MANEKRVRVNNVQGTLGTTLLIAGTTIDFGSAPSGVPTIDSTKHLPIIIEPDTPSEEIVYLTTYTAGNATGTVLRGQEGTTAVQHLATAKWIHGPTKRDFPKTATARRTSGNLSLGATSWAAMDTGLDLSVPAQEGDMITAWLSGFCNNDVSDFFGDYVTLIGSTLTTSFGSGAAVVAGSGGAPCMRALASAYTPIGGPMTLRAVAGDIASGLITVRFVYRVTANSRTVFASTASTNVPLVVGLVNNGPQEA